MTRQYFTLRMKAKSTWFVFIGLIFYILIGFFNVNILSLTAWEASPSFFNANYASLFFYFALTFLTIPLFYIFMIPNSKYFDKDCVFTRYGSVEKYWMARSLTILMECFIYIVFLYFFILARALFFGQLYNFFTNCNFLLKAALSQTLCLYVLAVIDCYTTFLTGRSVMGFLLSYLFVAYDYASTQTQVFPDFFVFKTMAVKPQEMQGYMPNLIFIFAFSVLVTFIYFLFTGKKDYLPKKVNV